MTAQELHAAIAAAHAVADAKAVPTAEVSR